MRRLAFDAVPYGLQPLVTGSWAHYGRRVGPPWMVLGTNHGRQPDWTWATTLSPTTEAPSTAEMATTLSPPTPAPSTEARARAGVTTLSRTPSQASMMRTW